MSKNRNFESEVFINGLLNHIRLVPVSYVVIVFSFLYRDNELFRTAFSLYFTLLERGDSLEKRCVKRLKEQERKVIEKEVKANRLREYEKARKKNGHVFGRADSLRIEEKGRSNYMRQRKVPEKVLRKNVGADLEKGNGV